jgi:hypothetical protein
VINHFLFKEKLVKKLKEKENIEQDSFCLELTYYDLLFY